MLYEVLSILASYSLYEVLSMWVVRAGGDNGELRQGHYTYESRLIRRVIYANGNPNSIPLSRALYEVLSTIASYSLYEVLSTPLSSALYEVFEAHRLLYHSA